MTRAAGACGRSDLVLVKRCGVVPSDEVKQALGQLTQLWARAQADFTFTRQ